MRKLNPPKFTIGNRPETTNFDTILAIVDAAVSNWNNALVPAAREPQQPMIWLVLDVSNPNKLKQALSGHDVVRSSAPYFFNLALPLAWKPLEIAVSPADFMLEIKKRGIDFTIYWA